MPLQNKKPPVLNLSALIKGLSQTGVEFIIVDGIAAVAQGAPVTTFDLDIVHRRTEDNVERLDRFLKSIDAHFRRPDDKMLKPAAEDFKGRGHFLLSTKHGPLDVLSFIEQGLEFDDLVKDCVQIDFKGDNVHILSLEKLVALKRKTSAPADRHRLQILEETLRLVKEEDKPVKR